MPTDEDIKFQESVKELEHALSFGKKALGDPFYFSGISKCFEAALEHAWKHMKKKATADGLDAFNPEEAIKLAGRMRLIDDVEAWLDFLEDRNLAIHDYLGVSNEDYLKTIRRFMYDRGEETG